MSRPSSIDPNNPVVREIMRRAQREPRRKRKRYAAAALQTGGVESGFRELTHGDADSQNWRQERESVYGQQWARTGGPTNTSASVDRFFRELAQHDRGQPSYELAADVQRPAAQYRGRYRDWHTASLQALSGVTGGGRGRTAGRVPSSSSPTASMTTQSMPTFDEAGFEKAQRRQKVAELLKSSGRGDSFLFRSGLLSTRPVDRTQFEGTGTMYGQQVSRTAAAQASGTAGAPSGAARRATQEAASMLGIKEIGTSNRGREVDAMQKSFGMVAQPWCGIYLGTVLRKAGVRGVDPSIASVPAIEQQARNKQGVFSGGWHSAAHAREGDALITRKGQHVAYVEKVDEDGTIHAIGGNQTGGVTRVKWKPNQVYGVARPGYERKARSRRSSR